MPFGKFRHFDLPPSTFFYPQFVLLCSVVFSGNRFKIPSPIVSKLIILTAITLVLYIYRMAPFKPFHYLIRWLFSDKQVVTMEHRVQNLVLWQIVLVALIGTSVFVLVFLQLFGYIDLHVFGVGCAFLMGLLIAFCWSLTFLYDLQGMTRMLGVAGLRIHLLLCTIAFFAVCYSPLLPPPRFLA